MTSEPASIGFQNMYGFNADLTYASPDRQAILNGTYEGFLFTEEFMVEELGLSLKDIAGVRGEEWGRLIDLGLITEEELLVIIQTTINNEDDILAPMQNQQGINIWPVTTDNDIAFDMDMNDFLFEEYSTYILPNMEADNFVGWYCSVDGKIYHAGDAYTVRCGTHFSAVFAE